MQVIERVGALWAQLWTDAAPEQRHLTTQFIRNSFYFTAAVIVISKFGDRFAVCSH